MFRFNKTTSLKILTGLLSAYCFASLFAFSARPTPDAQLYSLLASLFMFVAIIRFIGVGIMFRWRRKPLKFLPPLLILLSSYLGGFAGHEYRDFKFKQDIPKYLDAVAWVRSQPKAVKRHSLSLPSQFESLAYAAQVEWSEECGFVVDFFWGAGFPVKHTVRRFMDSPELLENAQCHVDWRTAKELAEHWYELVD